MSKHNIGAVVGKIASWLMPLAFAAGAAFYITNVMSYDAVMKATVNGVSCGYVSSLSTLADAVNEVERELSDAVGEELSLDAEIDYSIEMVKNPTLLSPEQARAAVEKLASRDWCEAYVLSVDGSPVGANESREALNELIDSLKATLESGSVPGKLEITNELKIEKQICSRKLLMDVNELGELLLPGSRIESDSRVTGSAQMSITAFSALAPSKSIESINPEVDFGVARNTVKNKLEVGALEFSFVETVTVEEITPRQVIHFEDERFLVGHEEVYAEGCDGVSRVTYQIRRDSDGNEISRTVLDSEEISVAKPRIAIVGTKPVTEKEFTGTFIWPCRAIEGISSHYGWRDLYGKWDFHLGIDLPDDEGEPIVAADGGEVVFAGYTPSYGNNVKIRHDDKTETLYAHLKKIHVKVGDVLSQGEQLGTMGHTGVAYGTHLHYEIRINEKTVDPEKYMPALPEADDALHKSAAEVYAIYYPPVIEETPADEAADNAELTAEKIPADTEAIVGESEAAADTELSAQ